MRDVLLIAVFLYLVVQTLRQPWVGALLWTWVSTMNPHRLTWGFAYALPFAQVAALSALLSLMVHRKQARLRADLSVITLLTLVLWTCVTTAFAIFPSESFSLLIDRIIKTQLMTLVCLSVLRERKHIEYFIWVVALSIGFFGVKGGIFAIMSGGGATVWGPPNSLIEGNNEIGLALVIVIPLLNYLRLVSIHRWLRRGLVLVMLLCAAAALSTQSRGAFLAMSAMGLLLWARSRSKIPGAIVIGAAAMSLLAFMPASWEARMHTIGTYRADSSAMGRINAWTTAINIANDRPTGAGFSAASKIVFERYSPDPNDVLTAHSIYFQMLGEHGWVGLLLFLALGALSFWNASQLRKRSREHANSAWLHDLGGMIQVSMVGYGVGGAFLSLAYMDLIYNVMIVLLASKFWLREERWRTETVGAFGSKSAGTAMKTALPTPPGRAATP